MIFDNKIVCWWFLALLLGSVLYLTHAVTYVVQEPLPSGKPLDKYEKWLRIKGKGQWILGCHETHDCQDYPNIITLNRDIVRSIKVQLSNNLVQDVDFIVSYFDNNTFPSQFNYQKSREIADYGVLYLRLLPGRSWSGANNTEDVNLYLQSISVKHKGEEHTADYDELLIGRVIGRTNYHKHRGIVPLPLPDASKSLNKYLSFLFNYYHFKSLHVYKSSELMTVLHKRYTAQQLLRLDPPIIFIDGTHDASIETTGALVDEYISRHGVLELTWEPYKQNEPRWWILMVRPSGMPGHLFAILDNLQYRHPYIHEIATDPSYVPCKTDFGPMPIPYPAGCTPGCKNTYVHGMTASGWGGDTGPIMYNTIKAIQNNRPMEIAPVKLGKRTMPPHYEGYHGWQYSFGHCNHTSFFDCYFLDHSGCPKITFDVRNYPGDSNFNKSRFLDSVQVLSLRPEWWSGTIGFDTPATPEATLEDLFSTSAQQVFYAYPLRPNYPLRVHIDQMVKESPLNNPHKCALLHIRRGDILFHINQARTYVKFETYIEGARTFLDVLGIKNILILTDSMAALEEATMCKEKFPALCGDLTFQWVDKKRWIGGEGGWENPFPSGSSKVEFDIVLLEFSLAQQCDLIIQGQTSYADRAFSHMCCKFPLKPRGLLPNRCICPARVKVHQFGYDCSKGNSLMCFNEGDSKYNFTLRDGTTPEAYMDLKYVEFAYKEPMDRLVVYKYHDVMNNSQTQENIRKMAIRSKRQLCSDELDHSIERRICGDQ